MTVFLCNLWSSTKQIKPPYVFDGEHGIALHAMQVNRASSRIDLGYTELFHVPARHQCPSRLVTVFLGTLWSSIKQIKAPCVFDAEHGFALHTMQGNRASS